MIPVLMLVITGLASVLGWGYMRGRARWVSLSLVWLGMVLSLAAAALCQAVAAVEPGDVLNVTALALSLAGLVASPRLWEDQILADRGQGSRQGHLTTRDLVSWRPWELLSGRIGPTRAAIAWLATFSMAWAANLAAGWSTRPGGDQAYVLAALAAPGLFGLLSTIWMYRGLRRAFSVI